MLTQTKVYLYNGEGELAETALYNGEVSAANEQQRYRYEYDSLGRVICSQKIKNGALHQGTIKLLLQQAQNIRARLHMRKTIFWLLFGVIAMGKMFKIITILLLLLTLPGFFWPWYLDNYPTSQHDTTWATEDCSAAFYIPVDELFDYAECRLDVAGDMSLYIDLGPGVSTINIALQSVVENNAGRMYMESYIEHWWVISVKPGKYTVRVEETTYFTPGEILTFYCVDGNHLDDPEYLQAEIAKLQREERKSQWIARGILAGVVVLVVTIIVLLLRRKRHRRKLG